MKLSETKCGNEIFYAGEPHIVIADGRRTSTKGDAATMATVWIWPTAEAGLDENGTLELGYGGGAPRAVNDEDVPLIRSSVEYHASSRRSARQPDGSLACEKTNYTAAECAVTELRRQKLLRDARAAAEEAADILFRKAVRDALDKDVSVALVQQETGLSRARIYQIRDNRR